MSIIHTLIDFVLHIDKHLITITQQYGAWSYAILFFVIFMETGLVVTPFLPGDSLLFAAGSLAAFGSFHISTLLLLMIAAAVIGDTVNYWIGREIGGKFLEMDHPLIKRKYLQKAQHFYDKHGPFAIVLGRFVPIVRTFAPFVAGIGKMDYKTFFMYNVIGGIAWVSLFTLAGYFFGNIPFIKDHFEYAMIAIVAISMVPIAYEFIKAKLDKKSVVQELDA